MGTRMIAAVLLASGAAAAAGELPREAICIRVVDGDTLDVCAGRDTFAVRLIGVDTPEKYDSPKLRREIERTGRDAASIQKLGEAASKFTALLVQGKDIRLDVDPANVAADHKDKSGRLLANPSGKEMISAGDSLIIMGTREQLTSIELVCEGVKANE